MIEWWDTREGGKKLKKKFILAIFSFFQDNLCFLGGDNWKWVSHWNVYLPLLFLLLLRPWYSHCLKGTFCVDLFDEKWFCFVNYVVNFIGFCIILFFCGKLSLMLFIFYLIRKCNLIWRSGCVCVRVCARMCLRAWVLECVSSEWFGEQEICVDRATENGRKRSSLCFFFSLSPSLLPVGQGLNPNVSWNKTDCSFFLMLDTQS